VRNPTHAKRPARSAPHRLDLRLMSAAAIDQRALSRSSVAGSVAWINPLPTSGAML
jgi:hypothetical protein